MKKLFLIDNFMLWAIRLYAIYFVIFLNYQNLIILISLVAIHSLTRFFIASIFRAELIRLAKNPKISQKSENT